MSNPSVWKDTTETTSFKTLSGDLKVDVAIIGGGITGISAAYNLAKAGKKVAVLEAHQIGEGATGYSTGNLYCTIGSPGLHSLLQKFDVQTLKHVAQSREAAVNFIEQRIKEFNIECDFKRVSWNLYTEDESEKSFIEKEKDAAQQAGISVSENVTFPAKVVHGFSVANQAQFNPLQYVVALAKAIESPQCLIYENTKAVDFKEGDVCTVTTEHGIVTAEKIIMATHTPKGVYFVHTSLGAYREYAVAVTLNGTYPQPGVFWDVKNGEHYSMRVYDTTTGPVLMALGEMHKVGQKEDSNACFERLTQFLKNRFDVKSVEFKWSAQQFKAADGIPFIGLSTGNDKTYIATGFSADGLTYGTLASMIISDKILGIENEWSKTYDASRLTPLASAKEFLKENMNVAAVMLKDWVAKANAKTFTEVHAGEGKIMEVDGKKCAVHRNSSGQLNVMSAVCPHLGCVVHWNNAESSWDCPCHGSRFGVDGTVLEGPAIQDLKKVSVLNDGE